MTIDLFAVDSGLKEEDLHPKFRVLARTINYLDERELLQRWANDFVDRDNKVRKEFQTTFHSVLWELYLLQVLRSLGADIDWSKNRPDFVVKTPLPMVVEAAVAEIKKDGRREDTRSADDFYDNIVPPWDDPAYDENLKEGIVRCSNAVSEKVKKYRAQYCKFPWVSSDAPFVIAVSSYSQVGYGREFHYPMMALLYGQLYDARTNEFNPTSSIVKPNTTSDIQLGIFDQEDMRDVSAVLFSSTLSLGKLTALAASSRDTKIPNRFVFLVRHDCDPPQYVGQLVTPENPEDLFDGLFVLHNPNARNKLPTDLFGETSAVQVVFDERGMAVTACNLPLVRRLCAAGFPPFDSNIKNALLIKALDRFNAGP